MATVDGDAKGTDAAHDGVLTRHPLFFFFLLSFTFTWGYFWLIWTPLRLPDSFIALGGFGPAASAFLVLALTSGRPGVLRLLRSIVHWRVGAPWYLVTLLGLPVLNFLAFLEVSIVYGAIPSRRLCFSHWQVLAVENRGSNAPSITSHGPCYCAISSSHLAR
ncbi:MAG: hypothetical protein WCE87_11090 [Candidatus Udaeobacter sp.]